MEQQYWAIKTIDDGIGDEINTRVDDYRDFCDRSGQTDLWRRSNEQFYRGYYDGGEIQMTGKSGSMRKTSINHYRNILQHIVVMTTQQRPAFEAKSVNTDYKSQAQTILANGLLDYYMRYEHFEQHVRDAVGNAVRYGEGWVVTEWDDQRGEVVQADEMGNVIHGGDFDFSVALPWDVARDTVLKELRNHLWFSVRKQMNRYLYAQRYPQYADVILSQESGIEKTRWPALDIAREETEDDNITITTLYHKPCNVLPAGRRVEVLPDGTVTFDGDMPYKRFPVSFIVPDENDIVPFGSSIAFELLPVQQTYDHLASIVVSNQNAFGTNIILNPRGSRVEVTDIDGTFKFIDYDQAAGVPQVLSLLRTPQEVFGYMQTLERFMETLSGINSVARGNPESNLKSGAALALVQSMAIQYSSALQHSYAALLEDVGTTLIEILKQYASVPRIALIAGKTQRSYVKQFTSEDISDISRVVVDVGNPLMRVLSGRVNMADAFLERGIVKTPDEYLQVVNTGRLEALTEGATAELMLIRAENERLMMGEQVIVIDVDNHKLHIEEHKTVLASPDARMNPAVVQATLDHISGHIESLRTSDPELLALTGNTPLQSPPPPAGGIPAVPEEMPMPEGPSMPNMPTNPLTGQEFTPETGGL